MSQSSSHCQQLTPSRTVVASSTPRQKPAASSDESGDWILSVASAPDTVSCALSNGHVQVYDATTLFPIVSYVPVQPGALVTDMTYGPESSLWTCGNDGSVTVKDLRQPGTTQSINLDSSVPNNKSSHESALSLALGLDGHLLAVSISKARIYFFDVRNLSGGNALLGFYENSHRDAITQVRFHPDDASLLLSAGEDGLACVYNVTRPSEDAALESVLNIGAPCRRVGFCGPHGSNISCLTGSETASVWDWQATTCLNTFGDFSLRGILASTASIPIDYLVNATWDPVEQALVLCAGNNSGNLVVFHSGNPSNGPWQTRELLLGGHHGVVRDWCRSHGGSTIQFTAGEDARLCEWNRFPAVPSDPDDVCMVPSQETEDTPGRRIGSMKRPRLDASAATAKP
jgi:WD repeat-containing protein 89